MAEQIGKQVIERCPDCDTPNKKFELTFLATGMIEATTTCIHCTNTFTVNVDPQTYTLSARSRAMF